MLHKEEPQATRLLEQLYELSLSDRMIAALCAKTPGQVAALFFQKGGAALFPGVLVPANDHGILILPQIKNTAVGLHGLQQVRFYS